MKRLVLVTVLVALTLSSCAVSAPQTVSPLSEGSASASAADQSTGELAFSDESTTSDLVYDEELVVFIAAGERMLANGPHEGAIYDSPEVYVAVARSFCHRLDDGETINRMLAGFAAESGLDLTSHDDRILIGSLLGAGVETLCPHHRDLL